MTSTQLCAKDSKRVSYDQYPAPVLGWVNYDQYQAMCLFEL